MRPVVIIPFSSDDVARRRALAHVRRHYGDAGLRVVIGEAEPFSKGAAAAEGVERSKAEMLVIADADCLISHAELTHAVDAVVTGAAWSQPHRRVVRMAQRATEKCYDGRWPTRAAPAHPAPRGGGIVVMRRAAWDASGGIDPRFIGWGGDDISFARALDTLAGPCAHLNGIVWHLWHPRTPRRAGNRGSHENEALAGRYLDANGDPDAMRAIIAEVPERRPADR